MSLIAARPTGSTRAIFVNYRRDDSSGYAGRLFDRLREQYGVDSVFLDISGSIEPGVPFPEAIERAIVSCNTVLALIGPEWLTLLDHKGQRRIDDPDDFVRLEIAKALGRGIRVIPILVQGATMPGAADLPDDLQPLARLQAVELSDGRWDFDVSQLLLTLDKILKREAKPRRLVPMAVGAALLVAVVVAAIWMMRPDAASNRRSIAAAASRPAEGANAPAPATGTPSPAASGGIDASGTSQPAGAPAASTTPPPAAGESSVPVPDVRNLPLPAARTRLMQAGLRPGRINYLTVDGFSPGTVYAQDVEAGASARPQATIGLHVAREKVAGLHLAGVILIYSGAVYDLDGAAGGNGSDVEFTRSGPGLARLQPMNGALLALVGTQRPTRDRCESAPLSATPVQPRSGGYLCVQTSEKRFAMMRTEDLSSGFRFSFETFDGGAPGRAGRRRP